jgi:hypothetical protein
MWPLGPESHTAPRVPTPEAKQIVHSDNAVEENNKVGVSTEKGVVVVAAVAVSAVAAVAESFGKKLQHGPVV